MEWDADQFCGSGVVTCQYVAVLIQAQNIGLALPTCLPSRNMYSGYKFKYIRVRVQAPDHAAMTAVTVHNKLHNIAVF